MILYLFAVVLIYMLARVATRTQKKAYIFLIIFVMAGLAGFRGRTVGIDTPSYYANIIDGFPYHWKFREEGFRFISSFLMKYTGNAQVVILFCAIITNLLIILRFWDLRKNLNFSFAVLLYLLIYYSNSLNIMRQYLAVAIIFFAVRYIEKKNYVIFIASIIISFLFHRSALFAIIILFIPIWDNLSKRQKIVLFFPTLAVLVAIFIYIFVCLESDIAAYSSQTISNLNIPFFYRLLIFFLSYLATQKNIYFRMRKSENINVSNQRDTLSSIIGREVIIYSIIGLVLESLSMFFSFVGRIGLYFLLFEIIYWAKLIQKTKSKCFFSLLILIYAVYVFAQVFTRNSVGILPFYLCLY